MKPISPAGQAKDIGLPSLELVCHYTNKPRKTLENWCRHNPDLFDIVLRGAMAKYEEEGKPDGH